MFARKNRRQPCIRTFCLIAVIALLASLAHAQTASHKPTRDGLVTFNNWPFRHLILMECTELMDQARAGKKLPFACDYFERASELHMYLRHSVKTESPETRRQRYEILAHFVLAGGTRVKFFDMETQPERTQTCTFGTHRQSGRPMFNCYDWKTDEERKMK